MHYLLRVNPLGKLGLGLLGSTGLLPQTLVRELSGNGRLLGNKVGGNVSTTKEKNEETSKVLEGISVLEVGESIGRPDVVKVVVDTQRLVSVSSILLVVVLLVRVSKLCGEGVDIGVVAELC